VERVFLDANVLFSAAYRPDAGLRRLWDLSDVKLLTSAYAIEEARINLPQADQRHRLVQLLEDVEVMASTPMLHALPPEVDLPDKDRPILLGAIAANATHLLTGDLSHFGPYYGQTIEGVLILRPGEYLRSHVDS